MVGQILSNNNEKCYSNFSSQLFHLNTLLAASYPVWDIVSNDGASGDEGDFVLTAFSFGGGGVV
jgi:hypothetical protein